MDGMEMLLLSLDCKKIVMSETDWIKGRKEPKFGLWPRNLLKDLPRVASVWPIKNILSGFACGEGKGGMWAVGIYWDITQIISIY